MFTYDLHSAPLVGGGIEQKGETMYTIDIDPSPPQYGRGNPCTVEALA